MPSNDDILLEEAFQQKPMNQATYLRLLGYVAPYRRMFRLNLLFTLLATASQLLGPKFVKIGIDRYLTNFSSAQAAFRGILLVSAIYLINLLFGCFISAAQAKRALRVSRMSASYLAATYVNDSITVGQVAMNDLRLAVFEHIQRLSLSYFDKTHQGRIISRADSDIDSLDRVLTWGANQLLASALTLLGVLVLLLQYD